MSEPGLVRPLEDAVREAFTASATAYRQQLHEGDKGWQYLTGRGLDEQTIKSFGLGYVVNPINDDDSRFQGRVSIPFIGPSRNVCGIKYRAIEDDVRPKYDSPGGRVRMFNTRALYQAEDSIACTEGEFDCIILNMIGVPAVACPGASVWPPFYSRIFAGFSRVIFTADNDDHNDEGKKWARKAADSTYAGEVRVMPEGHDIGSLYLEGGAGAVLEAIDWKAGTM